MFGVETRTRGSNHTDSLAVSLLAGLAACRMAALRSQHQRQPPGNEPPDPVTPRRSRSIPLRRSPHADQPRHAKLGLAGKAENWPLAGYAFRELVQGFGVIARAVPRYKGLPVGELVDAAMKQPFAVLDFAIKAGDTRQFNEAYGRITAGCNACHTTTDNPFVVIKTPDSSNFPNPEFQPGRR